MYYRIAFTRSPNFGQETRDGGYSLTSARATAQELSAELPPGIAMKIESLMSPLMSVAWKHVEDVTRNESAPAWGES